MGKFKEENFTRRKYYLHKKMKNNKFIGDKHIINEYAIVHSVYQVYLLNYTKNYLMLYFVIVLSLTTGCWVN